MSKGNMFLGYARGKVGSVVFSRLYGQQVTRAYNGSPKNPRSYNQARQRMLFASVAQYYASFRYIIEQGQTGIAEGQPSVIAWQKRVLAELSKLTGNTAILPNQYGWKYPQGLPISLTSGTLSSLDYSIREVAGGSGNAFLTLQFKNSFTTEAGLLAMTLGDFRALYPTINRSAQFTVVMAYYGDGDTVSSAPLNFQTHALYGEFVISEDAGDELPFFVVDEERYIVNPAILAQSWGGNFDLQFRTIPYTVDNVTYYGMGVIPSGLVGDGTFPVAGAVITSYYNGSQWNRSTSPMAVYSGEVDVDAYISTYQQAASKVQSDLYLNQAQATATQATRLIGSDIIFYHQSATPVTADTGNLQAGTASFDFIGTQPGRIIARFNFASATTATVEVVPSASGIMPDDYVVTGNGTNTITVEIPDAELTADDGDSIFTIRLRTGGSMIHRLVILKSM